MTNLFLHKACVVPSRVMKQAFVFLLLGVAAWPLAGVGVGAQGAAGGLEVLPVRPNFYLVAGGGGNVGVQVGEDGVVVVDTGAVGSAGALLTAIRGVTKAPIRYVINTTADADHVGGNETVSKAG